LTGKRIDSPIRQFPSDWELTTLGEVCKRGGGHIQTGPFGSQLHASDYVSAGIPSIMPVNIGDNRVIADNLAKVRERDAERLKRHRVKHGDIIYSRRGDVERRALVREKQQGWLCGTGCLKIDLGAYIVDPLYASYYLGHPDIRSFISRHAIGSTMPNLNTTIMSSVPFLLPPPDEQRAIARILGSLDDKIELNRQMNRTLEAMTQALFKSWFVDFDPVIAKREGRRPFGMNDATASLFPEHFQQTATGLTPVGWRQGKIEDVVSLSKATINPGGYPDEIFSHYSIPAFDSNKTPIYEPGGNIKSNKNLVPDICILISKLNPEIPRVWMMTGSCDHRRICSTEFLVTLPKEPFSTSYIYCLFSSGEFAEEFATLVTGTSNSHQRVKPSDLLRINALLPPKQVLAEFARPVSILLQKAHKAAEDSSTLATLRDTLLPKLLSGEIRVRQAEKIVSGVT